MILIFSTVINAESDPTAPSVYICNNNNNVYIRTTAPQIIADGPQSWSSAVWVSCKSGWWGGGELVTREDGNKETGHYIKTR